MVNENSIKIRYIRNFRQRYIAANMYIGRFEADILKAVPKDGGFYLTEYEIKISKSDLKADAKKEGKYEQLTKGIRANKFNYIVSKDLYDKIKNNLSDYVPEWAGMIYAHEHIPNENPRFNSLFFQKVRNAKVLRKDVFTGRVTEELMDKFYYAYWNLLIKYYRTKQ